MIDTYLITVADAIKEEIDAAVVADDFGITFETSVLWGNRKKELHEESSLRVDVVPLNWTMALDADGMWRYIVRCQVGVRKKFEPSDDDRDTGKINSEEIQTAVNLLAELIEMFAPKQPTNDGRALSSVPGAAWVPDDEEDNDPAVHAMIDWGMIEKRQFLGWFELVYEVSD